MSQLARSLVAIAVLMAGVSWFLQEVNADQIWEAGGYTFSDELGGFEITNVSGSGSDEDPIVVEQRLTEIGPAVLVIRPTFASDGWVDFRHMPFLQVSIVAVITNASRRVWAGFDLELQEHLGKPSVYRDGLSFDQLQTFGQRLFSSDKFSLFTDLTEPYDRVRFEQGKVDHGETARFQIYITDVTPNPTFYLVQEPQLLMAARPARNGVSVASAPTIIRAR